MLAPKVTRLALVTTALFLITLSQAWSEEFLLRGVRSEQQAEALNQALRRVPSAKFPNRVLAPANGEEASLTAFFLSPYNSDVGDLARAVSSVRGCSLTLVLRAPGLSAAKGDQLRAALRGVRGVDAIASTADVKHQLIRVRLDGNGGARREEIQKALADYGVKSEGEGE